MAPGRRRNRLKAGLKELLGLSSASKSSTSLLSTREPSPVPQKLPRAVTPQLSPEVPPVHGTPGSNLLAPPKVANASQASAPTATDIIPNAVLDSRASKTVPPLSLDPSQTKPPNEEIGTERTKLTAWSGLKTLLKAVEASVGVFPPLKSAIGGLNQCIEIFEHASKGRKDYGELRSKLNSLLEALSQFLGEPEHLMMTTSMKNLSIGIDEELKLVREKYESGALRGYAGALDDTDEIMDCYHRIQGHLERLNLNANLSMWRIVDEQATELRLRQLSPTLSAVFNSAESEDVQRGPCTPGTRKQELIRLLDWARNKEAGDVYWMNGMAGTGKTTLAYSLCDELSERMELGASFFCSRLIPECRNVKLIIPSIAYQLARFSRPFRYALSQILEADPDVHTRVLKTQFESLLVKPLLSIKDTLPADFVVVIDALDECENENAVGQILDILLAQTRSKNLPVRVLLSSRPEPEIYPRMMTMVGQDSKARLVLHDLDVKSVKHDIKTFLQTELEGVNLTAPQLAALVERSGVLFIYASTAARYIKDGMRIMEHEERLNMVLGLSTPSLDGNNHAIDTLYTSILRAAFKSKHLDDSSRRLTKIILDTIVCAQEPMTAQGLAGLLRLNNSKKVDALLRPLCSVLNIAEKGGLVTTLHASFPDFLLDQNRSSTFCCDPKANHARIAKACFEVLEKNELQFNICKLESSYLPDNQVLGLTERVVEAVSPALFYACRYWIAHLEHGERRADLIGPLYDFLSIRLLLWIEVLNTKRSMHLGPKIIQRSEDWSRTNNCTNEMIELAHDAWRFVTMFTGHAISRSTPHIYISMLPFWPESSPIGENYATRMRGAIKARGTAISTRHLALLAMWSFDDKVKAACFSPDGSLIAFSASSSVFLIDATTGRTILGPLEHLSTVHSVAFSPDGALIASGSDDKTIKVWSSQNGEMVVGPMTGHTEAVRSVAFSPNGSHIVSGSADNTLRVWDLQNGQTVVGPLEGHSEMVYSVCFSPDGSRLASGSEDRTVRVWDSQTGIMLFDPLNGHSSDVNSVSFSPDGMYIISCSDDRTIRVWSAQGGQIVTCPLEGHSKYIWSARFSPDGRHIVSASGDYTLRLWDLDSDPVRVRTLEGHTGPVNLATFSYDGSRIVSCSDDRTIRVWDARSRATVVDSLEGHTGPVTSVGFSPDGKHIVSGSFDKTIRMWDTQTGKMVGSLLKKHAEAVRSVCFSADGTRIASGSQDMTVRVWNPESGKQVFELPHDDTYWVRSVCFSYDSSLIVSGSNDATVRVWDVLGGKLILGPLKGHTGHVTSVHISPSGRHIVSGSEDCTIRLWDAQSGETIIEPLQGHSSGIQTVSFSSDGSRIASGSTDQTVRVWDARSGKMIFDPLEGHNHVVNSVCFSPNGTTIVSGSDDQTIRLWDARSGQAIGNPLVGHTGPVNSVAFSPDGTHIVSGSSDQTIRIRDVRVLLQMHGLTDYLPSPNLTPISPLRSHESWVLHEDGWLVDPQDNLLAWVPPDLQHQLLCPGDKLIISTKGSFQIDYDSANLGESWIECYQLPSH